MVIRKNIHNSFILELENTYSKIIIRGIDIIQISKIRNENFKFVIIFKV